MHVECIRVLNEPATRSLLHYARTTPKSELVGAPTGRSPRSGPIRTQLRPDLFSFQPLEKSPEGSTQRLIDPPLQRGCARANFESLKMAFSNDSKITTNFYFLYDRFLTILEIRGESRNCISLYFLIIFIFVNAIRYLKRIGNRNI